MRPAQEPDRYRSGGRLPIAGHQLLGADEPGAQCLLESLHHDGFGEFGRRDAVQPGVDYPADNVGGLHVHAVRVQMSPDAVERLLRHQTAIGTHEVVRHQQHPDRRIGNQAIDEGVSSHPANNIHQMRESRAVDGIDRGQDPGVSPDQLQLVQPGGG